MQIYFVFAADYVGIGRKRTNDCADAGWRMRGCNPRERTKTRRNGLRSRNPRCGLNAPSFLLFQNTKPFARFCILR